MQRLAARAGMAGPLIFASVFTIEGWLRPGYQARAMFVSELALGPRGWVQTLNFFAYAVLLFTFALGVRATFREGPASRAGPPLLGVSALAVLLAGLFAMDPATTPPAEMSVESWVHALAGTVLFTSWPVTCLVFLRRFRGDPQWRWLAGGTLAAALVMLLALVAMAFVPIPAPESRTGLNAWAGAIQRTAILAFLAWQCTLAWGITQQLVPTRVTQDGRRRTSP